jgi:hypothetical protein
MWLKEISFFKQVNFVFLIIGHTKNACNRLFNSLKHKYRNKNILTIDKLFKAVKASEKITVGSTVACDFLNYDGAFIFLHTE